MRSWRATPDDQQLIAYRATALRLLGREEYRRLYDYERLVRVYRLRAPGGPSNGDISRVSTPRSRTNYWPCIARRSGRSRRACAAARRPNATCRRTMRWSRSSSR